MGLALPMLAMEAEMKTQPTTHGSRALTLIELLVVICIVVVTAALLLPVLSVARTKRSRINCVNNLKQDGLAFRMWEADRGGKYPMQVSTANGGAMEFALAGDVAGIFRVMSNELSTPKVLVCPEDTNRHYATNFTADLNHQTISYFVALDAEDRYPRMFLSGDDNLEANGMRVVPGILNLAGNDVAEWTKERDGQFHPPGNIIFVDGSWQQTTSQSLQQALRHTGFATNRFLIP